MSESGTGREKHQDSGSSVSHQNNLETPVFRASKHPYFLYAVLHVLILVLIVIAVVIAKRFQLIPEVS